MDKIIRLHDLSHITILFEGDFHQLASIMLAGADIQSRGTGNRSRPTIYGVVRAFAQVFFNLDSKEIVANLRLQGFDPGAIIEWDDAPDNSIAPPNRSDSTV